MAHTTWFFDTFVLRDHVPNYQSYDERFAYLFNSYYNAEGDRHARPKRGMLSRPSLDEIRQALTAGVDRIMFDNMSVDTMRQAVALVRASGAAAPETEASGGITLETIRGYAETGVDFISVGALTHSAPALDLSLQLRPA